MALLLLPVSFISCGDDDDDNVPDTPVTDATSTDSGDELDEYSQKFVGYWKGSPSFVFYPDKRCLCTENSETTGFWGYSASTNILATTTNSWQWTITLFGDNYWAGVSVNTSTACSYTKQSDATYMECILTHKQFVSTEDPDSAFSLSKTYESGTFRNKSISTLYNMTVISNNYRYTNGGSYFYWEIDSEQSNTYTYYLLNGNRSNLSSFGEGKMVFSDPYSKNCRITFTGTINKVFTCFN